MGSIDDRIAAMHFDNAKFEAGVAKTMATLAKLNDVLKNIGATHGLGSIEKAANKINLNGLSSALDKLREKLHLTGATKGFSDIEGAANKISFGPLSAAIEGIKGRLSTFLHAPAAALDKYKEKLGFAGADKGLNNIENASNRVRFAGARSAADALTQKLNFVGATKSFDNIEKASGRVHLTAISSAVSSATNQFSVLAGAAAVALGSIATRAATAGASMIKSLTVDPITGGLKEYETNLNSIQTILANTKASGAGLNEVNEALRQLNIYSDQTIYNFSEMAKNIGTFTAAGVDLETSTQSIKGIANLAALSGSNSQQASTAMYQLSQAISAGRVSLEDWNSVVNAGMGGTVFQRALAQTAQSMGKLKDGTVELTGPMKNVTIAGKSFRESITAKPGQESWLTSDVLTNTLKQFTGDLSNAELAAMGFNEEQIKSIQETAIMAKKAATEVKTLSGVFDVVKESIGSGWSATFQLIFGDFEEAKTLFTGVSSSITGFIGASADARNKVLGDWKELGGRTVLIEGIKNVFEALSSVVTPIKDAFREIFPPKTGKDLFDLTQKFSNFFEKLKIGPETAENLKRTFAGFFALLSIGKTIVGEILGVFGDLFGAAASGSGGILNFTGTIGDFLVSVDKAIKKGEGLSDFFDGLGAVLAIPIRLLSEFVGLLGGLFDGVGDPKGLTSSMDAMKSSVSPLTTALEALERAWEGIVGVLGRVKDALDPVIGGVVDAVAEFGEVIIDAFQNLNFDKVFTIIQTGLVAGIFFAIKKALGGGVNVDFGGGVLDSMRETLTGLTGSLKAMQTNIKAGTLLKIASAVGILAAGVLALSLIDPDRLAAAMTAVAVGLGQLVAAMALLTKVGGVTTFATMPFIAASLILLATAVDVLAIAVHAFSRLSWEELIRGLVGVGGALAAIGLGVKLIPPSVLLIGPALLPLAVALNILAGAVKIFSTLDWEELAKGLIGVAGALTAVGIGTQLMGPGILLVGPGLIAVAVALNLLAGAVGLFGRMSLATIAKGIGAIAASLVVIGVAINIIPPTVALQAAGLILLSIALTGIAGAVALMGGLSIKTIAKGLAAIGASLVILAAGLTLMTGAIPGAVALLAAATALAVLAPVLGILGSMKWSTIIKGLGAMALILGVLAVGGILAAPGLTALGGALIVLGAGMAVVSGSVYILAKGLALLGKEGVKGITALMLALTALVALLPKIIIDFLKGLVDVAGAIAELAPKVVDAMVKIVESLVEVVVRVAPKMGEAMTSVINTVIKVINDNAANIIAAGFGLLLSLLKGINDNMGKVIEQVGEIILNFLTSILSHIPRIVASGANVLIKFLEGISVNLSRVVAAAFEVILKFLSGITQNIPKIVAAAANLIAVFVESIAANVGKLIKAGASLIINILEGIGDNVKRVAKAATDMVKDFFDAAVKAALDLIDAGAKAVLNFLNGVAAAIRKYSKEFEAAGYNIADAIIDGILGGISRLGSKVVGAITGLAGDAVSGFLKKIGAKSPSKVFMEIGGYMMQGLAIGVVDSAPAVHDSLSSTADDMIDVMSRSLSVVPDLLDDLMDIQPVITPVLDLSEVQKNAKRLGDLTNVVPITAAASYKQAASISSSQDVATADISTDVPPPGPITFEQNLYSPEALSALEIYRQTRNQLAQAKRALGLE